MINRLFRYFSAISRRRKMRYLDSVFPLRPECRALDIGGELADGTGQFLEAHPRKTNLAVVNIDPAHLRRIASAYPDVETIQGDARNLAFSDKTFDFVYSNAVIEHVGSLADQAAMAREVMRVGKRWFITTPNRWYPFEFHTRLPLVGWLPEPAMTRVARLWSYNHLKGSYESGLRSRTRLLTSSELSEIFPDSYVLPCRVTFWPETLVAIGPLSSIDGSGLDRRLARAIARRSRGV